MKNILIILAAICLYLTMNAQEAEFKFTITVLGRNGSTLSGIKVWMNNKSNGETITKRTGGDGIVEFTIGEGFWTVNLPGLLNYREIDVKPGRSGNGSTMFSYDYERVKREQKIIHDRQKMQFTTKDQSNMLIKKPTSDACIIKVLLTDALKKPVKDLTVELVSTQQKKKYFTKTDKSGTATLLVPVGEDYAVDVEGIKNFAFTGNVFRPGILTLENMYEPTDIKEINKNDTITQILPDEVKATTGRVYMHMTILDTEQNLVKNESVYMQQLITNKVYKGVTDINGVVKFLLPQGEKYMLHFDYQKDVDVFNYSTVEGRGNAIINVIYEPDPKFKYPERYIPKPDELFLEAYEHFITKVLPEPENNKKVDLFLKWGNNKVQSSSKEAVLNIGISASNDEAKFENAPKVDIAFVIDKSGSMAGYDRIDALKESMIDFIDKLRPDDYVSLITFDNNAFTDIPLKRKSTGANLKRLIGEIEPSGGTNIYNGMVLGYEQLLKSRNSSHAKQLILLTDGYGETEPQVILEKSKSYNSKGIDISAIGVGENYNFSLLTLLTQNSVGMMTHAGESKDIYNAFEKQLSNLIFPIASNVKLEVIFNNKIKFNKLFGATTKGVEKDKVIVDIGTLYMGYNKTAIALFDLDKPDITIEKEPVLIRMTYLDLESNKPERVDRKACLSWEPETGKMELILEQEQKKLYTIAILNQSIKRMVDAFFAGDLSKAKYTLENAIKQLNELYPEINDQDIQKLVATMTNYAKAIENAIKKAKLEEDK